MKNWSYTISDENHPMNGKTLWSGRYCAVVGFVFVQIYNTDDVYILANKRGLGTPDFQGKWNCPCGFLEADESGEEGVTREIYEETGFILDPEDFTLYGVQTDPQKCNNGNVSLRYVSFIDMGYLPELKYENINGEENEVEEAKWIHINDIDKYEWAFGHDEVIKEIFKFIVS